VTIRVSRRELLYVAGAAGGGVTAGALGCGLYARRTSAEAHKEGGPASVPFYGLRQAGVTTAQQKQLQFASFDVTTDRVEELRRLLRAWTELAARMARGATGPDPNSTSSVVDSGETVGLAGARLTLSVAFGPGLFETSFADSGFAGGRPSALVDIPAFPGDRLDLDRSAGDLCVQACADDPQVAFHAVRNLAAVGRGTVVIRWTQRGFRPSALEPQEAAGAGRNLLGFKDGTNNLDPADEERMAANVWVGPEDEPAWMRGGTYMVVRRIRMRLEHWDSVSLEGQERTFGRHKLSGAPLGGEAEADPVDPARLPPDCHILQANPRREGSEAERMLRRSYSFADGIDERFGELDAGLFFICFQRDPRKQFIPIQQRLAENDHLSEYIVHTGSAIFAIPPGVQEGGYIGETLLEDL
jgi:deferrochelatase/peroxidase EfeB